MRSLQAVPLFLPAVLLAGCVDVGQVTGFGCDDAGLCANGAGGRANGAGCDVSAECASGACVDGVCCTTACADACETCTAAGSEGTCTPRGAGTECAAGGRCDGTGRTCPTTCASTDDCSTGFACDGRGQCVDVDECQLGVCPAGTLCTNSRGSYRCACAAGYELMTVDGGASCVDIDECLSAGVCGENARCANGLGTYACGCLPGYRGSSTVGGPATCVDLDECDAGQSCGASARCFNLSGSFVCACDVGTIGGAVDGGPVTCVTPNSCVGVACGANGVCLGTDAGYECACRPGFTGAVVPNGPTSCGDLDECPTAPCGDAGVCTNTDGGFTCACGVGFGVPASGQPATCLEDPARLAFGAGTSGFNRAVPVGVPLPVGTRVTVLLQAPSMAGSGVSDSRGNRYRQLARSAPAGGGELEVFSAVLTTALGPLDSLTLQVSASALSWAVFASTRFVSVDRVVARTDSAPTLAPWVAIDGGTSSGPVYVLGSLFTPNLTALGLDGGFLGAHAVAGHLTDAGTGVFTATVLPGGSQWLGVESSLARPFAGALASFHDLPTQPLTGVVVNHASNQRAYTVSWTGGVGHGGPGGCVMMHETMGGTWTTHSAGLDCDSDAGQLSVSLPSTATWYGGSWSAVSLRVSRVDDNAVLATLPLVLGCSPMGGSSISTPTVDEDCDGDWNDKTCAVWSWTSSTVYQPPDGPCSGTSTGPTACSSTIEGTTRYTASTSTALDPSVTASSTSRGTSCSATDAGTVRWTCTGSACTWR